MSLIHQESFLEKSRELAEVSPKFSSLLNEVMKTKGTVYEFHFKLDKLWIKAVVGASQSYNMTLQMETKGTLLICREFKCFQGRLLTRSAVPGHSPVFPHGRVFYQSHVITICFAETLAFGGLLMIHSQGPHCNHPGCLHCPGFLNLVQDWIGFKSHRHPGCSLQWGIWKACEH